MSRTVVDVVVVDEVVVDVVDDVDVVVSLMIYERPMVVFICSAFSNLFHFPEPQCQLEPFFGCLVHLLVIFPVSMTTSKGVKTL